MYFYLETCEKLKKYELPLFPHEENATKQAPEGHDLK
jgi:hypothetical protein